VRVDTGDATPNRFDLCPERSAGSDLENSCSMKSATLVAKGRIQVQKVTA
jgi:hypothetical protein